MRMIKVVAEGQTETNFAKNVLWPHFYTLNKNVVPITLQTSKDLSKGRVYKGGIISYSKFKKEVDRHLKYAMSHKGTYVTTMVDLYGLPTDFPGYDQACRIQNVYQKVEYLEQEIKADILSAHPNGERIFLPYLQLHEFEALLFVDLEKLAATCFEYQSDICKLGNEVAGMNPEEINHDYRTAPSKRILSAVPNYDKVIMGTEVAQAIGLDRLRTHCKHFDHWIKLLENI